jgi:hypothetical protein
MILLAIYLIVDGTGKLDASLALQGYLHLHQSRHAVVVVSFPHIEVKLYRPYLRMCTVLKI